MPILTRRALLSLIVLVPLRPRSYLAKPCPLSEALRRRIWNGYRGGIEVENPAPSHAAKVGRDWLIQCGWAPDWSIRLPPGPIVAPPGGKS